MSTTTAKANGTVKATATTSSQALTVEKGNSTNGTIPKKEEAKPTATAVETKELTFTERKERSKRLSELFERHEKLKKHAEELLSIVRSDESITTRFYLESSNGDEWQTTNQEFIKRTVKVMHEAILGKIDEVETEIELIQIG